MVFFVYWEDDLIVRGISETFVIGFILKFSRNLKLVIIQQYSET